MQLPADVGGYGHHSQRRVRVTTHFLKGILDHNGRLIQEYEATQTRVLKEETAAQMVQILRPVVVNGSGSRQRFLDTGWPVRPEQPRWLKAGALYGTADFIFL